MQTSGTCAGERYHYDVSAQNKSFDDCPINQSLENANDSFSYYDKRKYSNKITSCRFSYTLERENRTSFAVPPPPQVAHFSAIARMSIESNILCKLHHKLPLMSAMARMSNQNVSGCDDKSHKTKNKKCPT